MSEAGSERASNPPTDASVRPPASPLGRLVRSIELGLIAVIFLALVVLGLAQIGLRNLADSALPWADPAMRAGVLWLAMLASVLAAGEARHIRIDVLGRLLPPSIRAWVERVLFLLTSVVCFVMTAASLKIVRIEFEFADLAFLGVPRWIVLVIVPIGFALMAWRFLLRAVLGGGPEDDRERTAASARGDGTGNERENDAC